MVHTNTVYEILPFADFSRQGFVITENGQQ